MQAAVLSDSADYWLGTTDVEGCWEAGQEGGVYIVVFERMDGGFGTCAEFGLGIVGEC